jgi:hypothetical protein
MLVYYYRPKFTSHSSFRKDSRFKLVTLPRATDLKLLIEFQDDLTGSAYLKWESAIQNSGNIFYLKNCKISKIWLAKKKKKKAIARLQTQISLALVWKCLMAWGHKLCRVFRGFTSIQHSNKRKGSSLQIYRCPEITACSDIFKLMSGWASSVVDP